MPYAASGPVAQSSTNVNLNWLSTYNTCQNHKHRPVLKTLWLFQTCLNLYYFSELSTKNINV